MEVKQMPIPNGHMGERRTFPPPPLSGQAHSSHASEIQLQVLVREWFLQQKGQHPLEKPSYYPSGGKSLKKNKTKLNYLVWEEGARPGQETSIRTWGGSYGEQEVWMLTSQRVQVAEGWSQAGKWPPPPEARSRPHQSGVNMEFRSAEREVSGKIQVWSHQSAIPWCRARDAGAVSVWSLKAFC